MGCSSGPDVVEDGLVLCLDAASKRSYSGSGTTWIDTVGGNNGTLTNGPTFSSANGGGIVFDGTDDNMSLNNMSDYQLLTSDYISIDIWFKSDSFAGFSRKYLFENRESTSKTTNPFALFVDRTSDTTGNLKVFISRDVTIKSGINSGVVYNVSYSIDTTNSSNNVVAYVNGSKVLTTYYNVNGTVNTSNYMYLSRAYPTTNYIWDGPIYRFSMYDKILTADEVRKNYLSTKERYQ